MADDQNITLRQLKEALRLADQRLDALELGRQRITPMVAVTIPATGWENDDAYPKYPHRCDVAISGLLETDIVAMESLPESYDAARAAGFMQTESYAGYVRLRAKHVPTEAILAQYRVIKTAPYAAQEEGT